MLKNLIIINDTCYNNGGCASVARTTAKLFAETGKYNVYFFCADKDIVNTIGSRINIISTQQGDLLSANRLKSFCFGLYNFKAFRMLKKLLEGFDHSDTVIHVHGWTKALSSSVIKACIISNFKVVVTLHDYFSACPNGGFLNFKTNTKCNLQPITVRCIFANCDSRNYAHKLWRVCRQFVQNRIFTKFPVSHYICVSKFSADILRPFLGAEAKISIIHNPVDVPPSPYAERIKVENNSFIGYVGRVEKEKGVNFLVNVCENLSLPLLLVGDGSLLESYKNIAGDKLRLTGWIGKDQLELQYEKMRVLVFPSYCYETAGLSVLEALVRGIPVIVSKSCAASEFVDDGITGLLFDPGIAESLELCLRNIQDDLLVRKMSHAAYCANKGFSNSYNQYKKALTETYCELLGS